MKFRVSSTELLKHLEEISSVKKQDEDTVNEAYLDLIYSLEICVFQLPNARYVKIYIQLSGSVKELIRRLSLYTEQIQSILFRVLRNARIHSLSIFFGLCCSRSGYIFSAITGSSSHPAPSYLR